jgi:tyrosyl-tRNA synthetase
MGKTASGAVWLSAHRLAPYDYFQFWRNTEDADVVRFLKLFTELPLDEIGRLGSLRDAAINDAKKILAFEATKLLHGAEAAQSAADTARQVFEQGAAGGDVPVFEILGEAPTGLPQLLVEAQICASTSEARRLVEQGAIMVADKPVSDWKLKFGVADSTPTAT